MPANLTPDYMRAEAEYRKASTPEERHEALKRMLAALPKHKGTEKMQADLRRRIAAAREDEQKSAKKKGFGVKVEREGAGQVVLAGPPNSGKSSLLSALTGARAETAPYPFTTRLPHPAMMKFEDVQVQIVDLPPVSRVHMEFWVPGLIRNADLVLAAVDLSAPDPAADFAETAAILEEHHLRLVPGTPDESPAGRLLEKKTRVAGLKADAAVLSETPGSGPPSFPPDFGVFPVSAETGEGLDRLREDLFRSLGVVRVYSKPPGREPDLTKPYTLKAGATLMDFAATVHRDFADRLQYARLWGHGKFEGQRITHDHVLEDKDVVELHL
jgi:hypothetical protein